MNPDETCQSFFTESGKGLETFACTMPASRSRPPWQQETAVLCRLRLHPHKPRPLKKPGFDGTGMGTRRFAGRHTTSSLQRNLAEHHISASLVAVMMLRNGIKHFFSSGC
jgi:hypothetical protein